MILAAAASAQDALPPGRRVVAQPLERVEADLIDRFASGRRVADVDRARHDLGTDLRLIHRHLLTLAAEGDAVAWLRAADVAALVRGVERFERSARGEADGAAAASAMKEVHARTFALPGDADAVVRDLGRLVVIATGGDATDLPRMRPAVAGAADPAEPTSTGDPLDGAGGRIRSMSIGVALREELLAFVAEAATDDTLRASAGEALAVARRLAESRSLGAEDRRSVEDRLVGAIALARDGRVPDLARRELSALDGFAEVLREAADFGGPAYAPLLAQARQRPNQARRIVGALRQFEAQRARYATLPTPEQTRLSSGGNWANGVEQLRGRFGQSEAAFLALVRDWPGNGGDVGALADAAAEVERWADLIAIAGDAGRLTRDLEGALDITPTGGLERAAAVAVARASRGPVDDAERLVAEDVLLSLARLAAERAAGDAFAERTRGLPGGDALRQERDALLVQAAAELADSRGAIGPTWRGGFEAALDGVSRRVVAAEQLAGLDAQLDAAASAWAWADWSVDRDVLGRMLAPLRTAVADAGASGEAQAWAAVDAERERLAPLLALLDEAASVAPAIVSLAPADPWLAVAARAQTPSAGAPFAGARCFSFAAARWSTLRGERADAALEQILKSLRDEHGYAPPSE